MHSGQEVRRVHYINRSRYLAAIKPSIRGVQILSSESGGVETRKEPSQMVLSEGLKLLKATAGSGRDPCYEQAGRLGSRRKATQKGTGSPIGTA